MQAATAVRDPTTQETRITGVAPASLRVGSKTPFVFFTGVACFHAVAGKHVLAEAYLRRGGERMAPAISVMTDY
jgi:hypothetical protein